MPSAGARVHIAILDTIGFILEFPLASPVVIESARRTSASRFPYSLWYVVDEGGVTILAVAHHRRKPDYWLDRLPS